MEFINLVEIQAFLRRQTNVTNDAEYYQILNELQYTGTIPRNSLETLLKKVNIKVSKFDELIKSKKKELIDMENFRKEVVKEKKDIVERIDKIKKEQILKLAIEKETKNLITPPTEEMEDNSPATIHEEETLVSSLKEEYKDEEISYNLKDCKWFEENSFKFGDILDTAGNRHYGYTFVGKNGLCENTERIKSLDFEEGVTVPINISKYLTDTVSKYSNYDWDESCILVYELPYNDVTVQKYNVKKDHMYEYIYGFNSKRWYLEQIDIKTGERTKPKKIYKKKKVTKKKKKKKN